MAEIRKLPISFKRYGYIFEQVKRAENKAIYSQTYEGKAVGYEVVKIRIRGARANVFTGKDDPPTERYPSAEDWGKYAWTFRSLDKAEEKYNSL